MLNADQKDPNNLYDAVEKICKFALLQVLQSNVCFSEGFKKDARLAF